VNQNPTDKDMANQANVAWWNFNLRLVGVCVFAWLCLTWLGALAVGQASVNALEFVTSAQLIPLSYLILVVIYCAIMNRRAAKASLDSERKLNPQTPDPAGSET
jgi:uncharacterized membrane protein